MTWRTVATGNIAIIPARLGSVGLPLKNLRQFCGKPLFLWSVECALEAGCFDAVYVSSDSDMVLAGVPIPARAVLRPDTMATSDSSVVAAMRHVLEHLGGDVGLPERICLLNPTSPTRAPEDITRTLDEMLKAKTKTALTLREIDAIEMAHVMGGPRAVWHPKRAVPQRRQERSPLVVQAGSVYWTTRQFLLESDDLLSPRSAGVVVPKERAVDIDDIWDWEAAEAIARKIGGRFAGVLRNNEAGDSAGASANDSAVPDDIPF